MTRIVALISIALWLSWKKWVNRRASRPERDERTKESLSRTVSEVPWTGPRLRDRWVSLSSWPVLFVSVSHSRAPRHCGLAPALRNIHETGTLRAEDARRARSRATTTPRYPIYHGSTELKGDRVRALNSLREFLIRARGEKFSRRYWKQSKAIARLILRFEIYPPRKFIFYFCRESYIALWEI